MAKPDFRIPNMLRYYHEVRIILNSYPDTENVGLSYPKKILERLIPLNVGVFS